MCATNCPTGGCCECAPDEHLKLFANQVVEFLNHLEDLMDQGKLVSQIDVKNWNNLSMAASAYQT